MDTLQARGRVTPRGAAPESGIKDTDGVENGSGGDASLSAEDGRGTVGSVAVHVNALGDVGGIALDWALIPH